MEAIATTNQLFHLQRSLRAGGQLDPFTFEVLLCNYRQALKSKYPGRGHDSELKYWHKARPYWEATGRRSLFLEARQALFDWRCLGEQAGWDPAARKELGDTWQKYGYFWSDLEYDFTRTTDLAHPVRRD